MIELNITKKCIAKYSSSLLHPLHSFEFLFPDITLDSFPILSMIYISYISKYYIHYYLLPYAF